MTEFWNARIPALCLSLLMAVGTVPVTHAAPAAPEIAAIAASESEDALPDCAQSGEHSWETWVSKDSVRHQRVCSQCQEAATEKHLLYRKYDDKTHWMECSVCGDRQLTREHSITNGKCACGYIAPDPDPDEVREWQTDTLYKDAAGHAADNTDTDPDASLFSDAGTIMYTVSSGEMVNFLQSDFRSLFQKVYAGEALSYVIFEQPDALSYDRGKLYLNYGQSDQLELDQSELSAHRFYDRASGEEDSLNAISYHTGNDFQIEVSFPFTACGTVSGHAVRGTVSISPKVSVIPNSELSYILAPGETLSFNEEDFAAFYRKTHADGTLNYVLFDRPSSAAFAEGTLYHRNSALSYLNLEKYELYYQPGVNQNALNLMRFVAGSHFSQKISLSFTAFGKDGKSVTGQVTITSTEPAVESDIEYSVIPGASVTLEEEDFNTFFRRQYPDSTINYVVFHTPDSSVFQKGRLYLYYNENRQTVLNTENLNTFDFYYHDKLSALTFVAGSDFSDTISLSFTAYDSSRHNISGVLTISADTEDIAAPPPSVSTDVIVGEISYTVIARESISFNAEDFNNVFQIIYPSSTLRFVTFSEPDASVFNNGTLYYCYSDSSRTALARNTLQDYDFVYHAAAGSYDLDKLVFTAGSRFKDGEIQLAFTAYGVNNRSVKGIVTITAVASAEATTLSYDVPVNAQFALKPGDFQTLFNKTYAWETLSCVTFTPSDPYGSDSIMLYYDYGQEDEKIFSASELKQSSTTFYYSDSTRGKYALNKLTLVTGSAFTEPLTMGFSASSGTHQIKGQLILNPTESAEDNPQQSSNYVGSIIYNTTTGTNVQIRANDIARYYQKTYANDTLQYVQLTGVPSVGSLYYNYYDFSSYATTTRALLDSSNCSAQQFFFSPDNEQQFSLNELTYEPSGSNYCAVIPFIACGTNARSVTGSILISVTGNDISEVYGITLRNTPVGFPTSALTSAITAAIGSGFDSIQLLNLPPTSTGKIYLGSNPANTKTRYTSAAGASSIGNLSFIPASRFSGSVEIPYVALNSSGAAVASGKFTLGILSEIPNFTDVIPTTWCYKYVMELADAGVIAGYEDGSFHSDAEITYGAALKLILLAAGYPEQAPTDDTSVFSGYLAKARAEGIITRPNVDLSGSITRLQIAQIASGALKLNKSNLSSVNPFTDTEELNIRALNAAGIIEGYFVDGKYEYRPNNTLTRGQVSAIVWRIRNYKNNT